jgi:hypothetical protein
VIGRPLQPDFANVNAIATAPPESICSIARHALVQQKPNAGRS